LQRGAPCRICEKAAIVAAFRALPDVPIRRHGIVSPQGDLYRVIRAGSLSVEEKS